MHPWERQRKSLGGECRVIPASLNHCVLVAQRIGLGSPGNLGEDGSRSHQSKLSGEVVIPPSLKVCKWEAAYESIQTGPSSFYIIHLTWPIAVALCFVSFHSALMSHSKALKG